MNNTEFIAKYLKYNFINELKECNCKCLMCGKEIKEGINKKIAIKSTFTDLDYIRYDSNYMCRDCFVCINGVEYENKKIELRKYHYLVTEKELKILQKSEIEDLIFNLDNLPFILCITYNHKKHTSFKSVINYSNDKFIIATDLGLVEFDMNIIKRIKSIIDNWYSIQEGQEDKKNPRTNFIKQEIKTGIIPSCKIEKYGIEKFYKENNILKDYYNTAFLNLLVYILNIKGVKDGKDKLQN